MKKYIKAFLAANLALDSEGLAQLRSLRLVYSFSWNFLKEHISTLNFMELGPRIHHILIVVKEVIIIATNA